MQQHDNKQNEVETKMFKYIIIPVIVIVAFISFLLHYFLGNSSSLTEIVRYFVFLRIPIIIGLLIILFPFIAESIAPNMLKNLLVLSSRIQLAGIVVTAFMGGLSVALMSDIILQHAWERFPDAQKLTYYLTNDDDLVKIFLGFLTALIIAAPISIKTFYLSEYKKGVNLEDSHEEIEKERKHLRNTLGIQGLGIGAIIAAIFGVIIFIVIPNFDPGNSILTSLIDKFTSLTMNDPGFSEGYIDDSEDRIYQSHFTAAWFVFLGLISYFLTYLVFKVWKTGGLFLKQEFPVLVHVLMIVINFGLVLGFLAFFLDFYRIPVVISLILISAISAILNNKYGFRSSDHYFNLKDRNEPYKKFQIAYDQYITDQKKIDNKISEQKITEKRIPIQFKEALKNRLSFYDQRDKRLVIVCSSGGGIQAAGWIVRVLTGLQKELGEELGKEFIKSIGLISSASGGSVGAMYYLDSFKDKDFPDTGTFAKTFRSAIKDSLDAIGWGLAYPDLWRILGLYFLAPKMDDSGNFLEQDWKAELNNKEETLMSWREKIDNGKIPVPVFNTTIVEDGRRFLITPMRFGEDKKSKSIDFVTLYKNYDMNIETAARLSASFPYITAVSRANADSCAPTEEPVSKLHMADGGYFDNFGVFTAVEWLDNHILPAVETNELNIKKILILELISFGEPDRPEPFGGWISAVLGPILTLYNIRESTQLARNDTEIELLKNKWESKLKGNIEIKKVPIRYTGTDSPLSWKLSNEQKRKLYDGWDCVKEEAVSEIKSFWYKKPTKKQA